MVRRPKTHHLDLDTLDEVGGVDSQGRSYATARCLWCDKIVRVVYRDLGHGRQDWFCREGENAWRAKSSMLRALRAGAFGPADLEEIMTNVMIYGHRAYRPRE